MNVPQNAVYQICINVSVPPNMSDARDLDKKSFKLHLPEQRVQMQINFTELFLMIPSTKIAQMVPLH